MLRKSKYLKNLWKTLLKHLIKKLKPTVACLKLIMMKIPLIMNLRL